MKSFKLIYENVPVIGLPQKPINIGGGQTYTPGPNQRIRDVAKSYMKEAGMSYNPPKDYKTVDPERATRIANEFDKMKHDPTHPDVKASYDALAKETMAQFHHIRNTTGLKISFNKPGQDPYAKTPHLGAIDVRDNNHLSVFKTDHGFGSDNSISHENHPMLAKTGVHVDGHEMLVNDAFRAVHDYFGHYKEGFGFRAAQPISAKVLSPKGWTTIGDIKVGDEIIDPCGEFSKVKKIHEHGMQKIYKVIFNDGSYTKVDFHHRWKVRWDKDEKWQIKRTFEILDLLKTCTKKLSVPITQPVNFEFKILPINPYLLGALLGDGHLSKSISIYSDDLEIIDRIKDSTPNDIVIKKRHDKNEYSLTTFTGSIKNSLCSSIKELGLSNSRSHNKFIPDIYKFNSVENRIALLRGLMDTDGHVNKSKKTTFTNAKYRTVSCQLADDIKFIVNSLGGTVRIRLTSNKKYSYKGEMRSIKPIYTLSINMPKNINPFFLSRKANIWKTKNVPSRKIVAIEECGIEEVKCISVDNLNQLYITDDFIVTMNSGEENAWRQHAAMYSPLARRAMTTETRGQNSFVNYGPHGEHNKKANASDTIYAPQKVGLMPKWTHKEGL